MAKQKSGESSCNPVGDTCCCVVGIVSVDERGQMVLPKELREKAGIRAGDKLAISTVEKDGQVCCIFLTRATELGDMVKATLQPVMKGIL